MKTMKVFLFFMFLTLPSTEGWAASENVELEIGEMFSCDVNDHGNNNYPWSIINISWEFSSGLHYSNSTSGYTNYVWVDHYISGQLYATVRWTETKLGTSDDVWLHKSYTWYFTVTNVPVNSVSIQSPIYLNADEQITITPSSQWMTVSPSNGLVETTSWTSTNTDVATIDNNGHLKAIWPGVTTISCMVNGSVKSNDATVQVLEPSFTFNGFSIADQTNNVETKPTITATYSLPLSSSTNFSQIMLTDVYGQKTDGTIGISGNSISFTPEKHLQPLTTYTLTIPKGAVKNKWGTDYQYEQKVSFSTTDWQRMTLSVSPDIKYLTPGDEITLTCSSQDASIYYSIDGSSPTNRYMGPIRFEGDMKLRAVAKLDGYYDSEELKKEYLTSVDIVERWPNQDAQYYNYADVIPNITFSYPIEKGEFFNQIAFTDVDGNSIVCQLMINGATLFLVPENPLKNGSIYNISLPEGALLVSNRGQKSAVYKWSFATGDYATAVSVGGPELFAALKTDGSLWTWGKRIKEANADDGSYSYETQGDPKIFVNSDVTDISSGYMHHAIIKRDGSLWMWGRQLCGEFGNGSTIASSQPVKIMDAVVSVSCGLQTTAIVKHDATLWMCGRNDQGQIDNTRSVYTNFVKVADGVIHATLNWGSIDIVKMDGTTETRIWDANADSGRRPSNSGLGDKLLTYYGWQNAIGLDNNGSVWTWSQTDSPEEVIIGRYSQPLEGISLNQDKVSMEIGDKLLLYQRPIPLAADYTNLEWTVTDNKVAHVSNRGVVTAIDNGVAEISVTISDSFQRVYSATCQIVVGTAQAIRDIESFGEKLKVLCHNRQIQISGISEGQQVAIYNVSGACIWQGTMEGSRLTVPVNKNGIYLIHAGRQACKVMVK